MSEIPDNTTLEVAMLKILRVHTAGIHTQEINKAVAEFLELDQSLLKIKRSDGRLEFGYRLAWVRTKAKNRNLIERTDESCWAITSQGAEMIDSSS